MAQDLVIGIDVGGQTAKCGVVDARGNIVAQTVISSENTTNADEFVAALAEALNRIIVEAKAEGSIRGIGVGIPNGNFYTGVVENAVNLVWAQGGNIPFAKMLQEQMNGIPVSLTNDANAAAMGEMTYGAARGMKNFIMITLGTGVGSGIVINGEVVYGHDGFAGELGHTCAVRHNGRRCNCGKDGCLETYASATGVARTAREWLDMTDEPSLLRSLDVIKSKNVYEAAKEGDKLALRVFDYPRREVRGLHRVLRPGGHRPLRRPRPRPRVPGGTHPQGHGRERHPALARQGEARLLPAQGIRRRHPRRLRPRLGTVSRRASAI